MMQLKGRALAIDDQDVWLEQFEELLCELGLEVVTANKYDAAIELLDSQYFHLAVVDMRLQDDDPQNTQGMDVLAHIDQLGLGDIIVKIVITGYGTREWARQSFKEYNVYDFIPKQGPDGKGFDEQDFVQSVQSAFDEKININSGLDVEFAHGLSLDVLVDEITPADASDQQRAIVRWEMDDLLRKLFPKASSLTVSSVSGGHSGGTRVIKVEPFYEGKGLAEALIVKYGQAGEIEMEARNFADYVEGFIAGARHTALKSKARTHSLGGIVYSLIGAPFEKVSSFNDFYLNNEEPDICRVLDELFAQNCRNWYENRSRKHRWNLAELYWRQVDSTYEKILRNFRQMYPGFVDRHKISFPEVDGEFVNPLYHPCVRDKPISLPVYIATTHGDLNGGNLFVDQDKHVWMIDFLRTGEGHIVRDFVTLESVIKFQLLEEESLGALHDFEKVILAPCNFSDRLPRPPTPMSPAVTKAFAVIEHLRELAGRVIQPSDDMRAYYAGLFYHTLNLIRYYYLLQLKRRKYYILLSAALLCEKLEQLTTTR